MKILLFAKDLTGIPLALRFISEGHEVLVWTRENTLAGKGLVDITRDKKKALAFKADFTLTDSSGLGHMCDAWPTKVYGGSKLHDTLEFERGISNDLAEAVGMSVPKRFSTKSFEEARRYVKRNKKPVVIKLEGEKYAGSTATFVSKEAEEAEEVLLAYEKKYPGAEILVQDKVEGIEISTAGFFNGEKFLPTYYHTLERKKLLTGDLGPSVGCAGDVVWNTRENWIVKKTLGKLEKALGKLGFQGEIDVNGIVSGNQVYFLEFTPRFGYNASLSWFNTLEGGVANFLYDLHLGRATDVPAKEGFGTSVSVYIPPYPAKHGDTMEKDVPILHLDDLLWFNPFDLWMKEDGTLQSAGFGGWIGSPAVFNENLDKGLEENYKRIKEVKIPNLGYRTDIGVNAKESLLELFGSIQKIKLS